MDANGYYIYLPAIFIYQDLKHLSFVYQMPEQFDRKYFLYKTETGGLLSKYSPGLAILELPFFAVAHLSAPLFGFEANGYTPPYRLAVALSTIFYTILGLWILASTLAQWYNNKTVFWTIFALFLATNIFFFSNLQAGLTHNYLFFLFSSALAFGLDWLKKGNLWSFFGACCCIGFAALIRPTEVLMGLVIVALAIQRWFLSGHKSGISDYAKTLATGALGFGIGVLPLLLYWKFATGNWIAYTYEQEGFNFDKPAQIWLGLFGFRKGWIIYTPLVALCIWAIPSFLKAKRIPGLGLAMGLYIPLNIFIVLSWWCWWYGGGFGQRALIPIFVLLAFPLAELFEANLNKALKFNLLTLFIGSLSFLNLFQSYQYQQQIIHMDGMTWPAYKYVFGKARLSDEEKKHIKTLMEYGSYDERGKKLSEYFK